MLFFSDHQVIENINDDLGALIKRILEKLGNKPDLTFVFVSSLLTDQIEEISSLLSSQLESKVLLGCTAETVLEGSIELEEKPAIGIWSAVLPEAELIPFHLEYGRADGKIVCSGFPDDMHVDDLDRAAAFFLGEPLSSSVETTLALLEKKSPGLKAFGGMASGANGSNQNKLLFDNLVLDRGCIGLLIRNGPKIRSIVSQGCRPIGNPFIITKADKNLLLELGGLPVLEQLQTVINAQDEQTQSMIHNGLNLGLVFNEYQDSFNRGDFLIVNVMGVESEQQGLVISHRVRVGQTVQFHVRDKETATEDLEELIHQDKQLNDINTNAALLFSCNGRGSRLFEIPNHDASHVQSNFEPDALVGFFAQGEIGPVRGKNHIHGFTASIALFSE